MAITYDDFAKVQFKVATILECVPLAERPRCFDLQLDLGDQKRQVQVELGAAWHAQQLVGKQAVVVANLGVQPVAPAGADPAAPLPAPLTMDDVTKINLRVAQSLECKVHANADKLLVVQIAVGEEKRQICAGLKAYYQPEQLAGRQLILVENLEPRKMRGEISQGMLLAASDPATGRVIVVCPGEPAASGSVVAAKGTILCVLDASGIATSLVVPSEPVAPGSGVK